MMRLFALLICFLSLGCGENGDKKNASVHVRFLPFYRGKVYLERVLFTRGQAVKLDSANLDDNSSSLHFNLPLEEESVYQLRVKGENAWIYFLTDVPSVRIRVDRADWSKYYFLNPGMNNTLRSFLDSQRVYADSVVLLSKRARRSSATSQKEMADSVQAATNALKLLIEKRDKAFADTVSSPGAFLFAYNRIDFGKNFTALKNLVTKAAQRFPQHQQVQNLKQETLSFVRIFEEEYEVGDILPDVVLPNQQGQPVSLRSFQGQYIFVDLWAPWCSPCLEWTSVKKKMPATYAGKLQLVSIAIDKEKEDWLRFISSQQVAGIHLIDQAMWRGKAAQTLKFDSIPFNFLLSPDGKILAKAVKQDSILPLLAKYIR